MALLSLNIYKSDDEIDKTFEANRVQWQVFKRAEALDEEIKKSGNDPISFYDKVTEIIQMAFWEKPTTEELGRADIGDIFSTFYQILNRAEHAKNDGGGQTAPPSYTKKTKSRKS